MNKPPVLILIRGLPGSGKSTLAVLLCDLIDNLQHIENDQYRQSGPDGYVYSKDDYNRVREESLKDVTHLLSRGDSVVVSNVFTRPDTMRMYTDLGYRTVVLQTTGSYGDVHGVDPKDIDVMRGVWEPYPGEHILGDMDTITVADIRKIVDVSSCPA